MDNELQLLTTREFNGHILDCYVVPEQEDKGDFCATREQIGQILGYREPRKAIGKIHERNKERLDKFSSDVKMTTEAGIRTTTVYNFKGLLEICRYSNQPNANAVIDKLWEIADEIRRNGIYMTDNAADAYLHNPKLFKQMAERYSSLERRIAEMERTIEETKPLTILGSVVLAQKGSVTFKDAADMLAQHGIDIGQNRLFKRCRDRKLLCSRKGHQWNKPCKTALDKGLFNIQISGGFNAITMITPKGLQHLSDELFAENYPLLVLLNSSNNE